jgi:hypothetical protein
MQIPSQRLVAFGPCAEVGFSALYFEVFEDCSVSTNPTHSNLPFKEYYPIKVLKNRQGKS